ncbi:hypothetical protein Ddye_016573 [Dipteronia dyeriana]|uniref:Reverse transcriptase domain-containing protein n=1 Tax=Dipteronia dyeriana TaxID=168575 RepID=A0AAD9U7X3_9ROSI|nr:hypothetical protein Ddye_016573 [Dipteronia dyeriana]
MGLNGLDFTWCNRRDGKALYKKGWTGSFVTWSGNTLITLIPKFKKMEGIADFRPISLCNLIYKIIEKALSNRLRVVSKEMISGAQGVFILGRQITNNTLIGFECIHALQRKCKGQKVYMALKLDMSKAYDRVKLIFI